MYRTIRCVAYPTNPDGTIDSRIERVCLSVDTKKFLHSLAILILRKVQGSGRTGRSFESFAGNTCPATLTTFRPVETRGEIVEVIDRESRRLISYISPIETWIFFQHLVISWCATLPFHHSQRHSARKKAGAEKRACVDGVRHLGANTSPHGIFAWWEKIARGKTTQEF